MSDPTRPTRLDGTAIPLQRGGCYLLVYLWGSINGQTLRTLIDWAKEREIELCCVASLNPEAVRILPSGVVSERHGTPGEDILT